jgi:hypothetical protein
VSDLGRLASKYNPGAKEIRDDYFGVLKPCLDKYEYHYYDLIPQPIGRSGRIHIGVHILVAYAFIGPRPSPSMQVRHKDGNPSNNKLSNLEYGTASDNALDKRLHGTDNRGEKHPFAKLTEKDVSEIRDLLSQGIKQRTIAGLYNVSQQTISVIKNNKNWK